MNWTVVAIGLSCLLSAAGGAYIAWPFARARGYSDGWYRRGVEEQKLRRLSALLSEPGDEP